MLSRLRKKYWIIKAKSAARKIITKNEERRKKRRLNGNTYSTFLEKCMKYKRA